VTAQGPNQDQTESSLLVGQTLGGRYKIVKLLGEGGMGAVYLGEQQLGATTRKVAVKTLHQHLSHDPKILARFERECSTVAELQHPNTIQIHDFGKTDAGLLYIVMEYAEGHSVGEELEKNGPMDPARVQKILGQVVGSLEEAHNHGIVHRDLKPDNILLCDRAGQKDWVEVLDFGIAKRSREEDPNEAKLTQQGMVLGTPPYMSPEQFTGQPIDARSDIYSLGVMAYEMLVGRLPFNGNTAWEWATQHMTQAPQPIETQPLGDRVPVGMRYAIQKSLAKLANERFATVREFFDAFSGASDAAAAMHAAPPGYGAPPPAYAAPAAPQGAARGKTEIGAPIDAPMNFGAPPPAAPMPMNAATPAGGNHAFGSPYPAGHGGYGGAAEPASGGGKRVILIALLGVAGLGCLVAVLVGLGVFSGHKKVEDPTLGLTGTVATTTPTETATDTAPTATDTAPSATTAGLASLSTAHAPPHVTPKDAGAKPPPSTAPTSQPTVPPTTQPTTQPTKPPPAVDPPECAQARKFCTHPAIGKDASIQALCNSNKAACFQKGGKL